MPEPNAPDPESVRLAEDRDRKANWKRWGPYLSERQWGTVREDYSPDGSAWTYFPHDAAPSRAYRWGEDGIAGFSDRHASLCFALALWNGQDPFLKERLFGLTPRGPPCTGAVTPFIASTSGARNSFFSRSSRRADLWGRRFARRPARAENRSRPKPSRARFASSPRKASCARVEGRSP
jgi:hypothetical protein